MPYQCVALAEGQTAIVGTDVNGNPKPNAPSAQATL